MIFQLTSYPCFESKIHHSKFNINPTTVYRFDNPYNSKIATLFWDDFL